MDEARFTEDLEMRKVSVWERILEPVASLVYGSPAEGEQPAGVGPKLFVLILLLALAALAVMATYPWTNFGSWHGQQHSMVFRALG